MANNPGPTIQRLREAAGLTTTELAARAGMAGDFIAALERSQEAQLTLTAIRKLAAGLGIPAWQLLQVIDEPAVEPAVRLALQHLGAGHES